MKKNKVKLGDIVRVKETKQHLLVLSKIGKEDTDMYNGYDLLCLDKFSSYDLSRGLLAFDFQDVVENIEIYEVITK